MDVILRRGMMGTIHHIVKVKWDETTDHIQPVDQANCPHRTELPNVCLDTNGATCPHMLPSPACKPISERYYNMHCGFGRT